MVAADPRLAWAAIAALFDAAPVPMPFVHPSAVVADTASLGQGVALGPGVVIGNGAEVHDGAVLGPGCHLGEGSVLGAGTRLAANVVLYHDVRVGAGCVIHAGVVLGADGFGFVPDPSSGELVKIPQIYGVRIGDNVEIGAGTTIDRGGLGHTFIGDGCKLDNQIQVGHGTTIGAGTVISGCTAIAGSVRIGEQCLIGGAVGIIDNVEIADRVEITAMTLVSQSIRSGGRWSSGTGLMPGKEWRRSVAGFKRLGEILRRLRRLETRLAERPPDDS